MATQQQKQAEKRQEKLDLIDQQVKDGTLSIRKMTAVERKKFPPRSPGRSTRRGARKTTRKPARKAAAKR
ncbi:hypothetical protein LCGC14_2798750 [marine sediment metagenome]|uniref:Uncharacterized protein n=1 Tax=marine sediment metagenome TaxID=412755 RepID=A0A0F8YNC7_9ZZZZ